MAMIKIYITCYPVSFKKYYVVFNQHQLMTKQESASEQIDYAN